MAHKCKVTRGASQKRSKEPSHNQSASPGSWLLRFPERPWGPGFFFSVSLRGSGGGPPQRGGQNADSVWEMRAARLLCIMALSRAPEGPFGSSFWRVSRSRSGLILGGCVGPPQTSFSRVRGTSSERKFEYVFNGSWEQMVRSSLSRVRGTRSRFRGARSVSVFALQGSWGLVGICFRGFVA